MAAVCRLGAQRRFTETVGSGGHGWSGPLSEKSPGNPENLAKVVTRIQQEMIAVHQLFLKWYLERLRIGAVWQPLMAFS